MNAIGIIANPASGHDIRRLVAFGTSISNSDKVSQIQRIIMGASITGIDTIMYLNDHRQLVRRAFEGITGPNKKFIEDIVFIAADNPVSGREIDSIIAADKMVQAGVRCIVTMGGDGTNRAVSLKSADIPIVPVSTGTNNIFPKFIEGTIAGEAAGLYATHFAPSSDYYRRSKRLEVFMDGQFVDAALVDVAVVRSNDIASRALWRSEDVSHVFMTSASCTGIGITSLGVYERETGEDEPYGVFIETSCDPEKTSYWVPFAPGLMERFCIERSKVMKVGESVTVKTKRTVVVAVDGERNVIVPKNSDVTIRLTWNGPKVLNIRKVMANAINMQLLKDK